MLLAENRTRVICHLPFKHSAHEQAFSLIMTYVRALKDEGIGLNGHTLGTCDGGWWSKKQSKWVYDPQRLLMLDYLIDINNPDHSLLASIDDLARVIENAYRQYNCPEDEFWIASQSMTRYFPSKRAQGARK